MDEEESGWKYVHGDVFRFPPYKNLFCAFVGTGTQVIGAWVVVRAGPARRRHAGVFVHACSAAHVAPKKGSLVTGGGQANRRLTVKT